MNKKTKRGIILTSLTAIAFAGSLLAGSTYALFTSESTTNIAVNSGNVDVVAKISEFTTYTGKADSLTGNPTNDSSNIVESNNIDGLSNGQFYNGGSASIDGNTLTLDKVTPGDKVTFKISVTNNTDVSAKYRTVITCEEDDGLVAGLNCTIGSDTFKGLTLKSKWTTLTKDTFADDIECTVELPTDAGNDYKGKTCKISYTIEAVQGNAATSDPDANVIEIDNAAQLGCFRDVVNKMTTQEQKNTFNGKTIKFTNNIDLNDVEWTPIRWNEFVSELSNSFKVTFDGNYKTISNFKVTKLGERYAGLFSCAYYASFKNLYIDKANITAANGVGALAGTGFGVTFEGCKVTNSTITASTWLKSDGKYDDGDKAGALAGRLDEGGNTIKNCTFDGNTITAYRDLGGVVGHVNGGTVSNNTIKNTTIVNDRTINPEGYTSNAEYNVHEVVGRTANTVTQDSNTYNDNVSIEVINNNEYVSLSVVSNDNQKGSVSLSGGNWNDGKVKIGDIITITATATSNSYYFDSLQYKVGSVAVGDELSYSKTNDTSCSIKVPNYDIALKVIFKEVQ